MKAKRGEVAGAVISYQHYHLWEWCLDYWHDNYGGLVSSAPTDGSAWLSGGDLTRRVMRGCSWGGGADSLRSAYRSGSAPDSRVSSIGFRVVAVARV